MATPGQPTLYKPEYCELAHNYCLLGATNETPGEFFGVTRRTIQNWIATHPDFADAVRRGRAAGATVVLSLRNRQREYWQAKAEAPPEFGDDDMVSLLDAAGESMRHAGD